VITVTPEPPISVLDFLLPDAACLRFEIGHRVTGVQAASRRSMPKNRVSFCVPRAILK
jgi:hypothetical protein